MRYSPTGCDSSLSPSQLFDCTARDLEDCIASQVRDERQSEVGLGRERNASLGEVLKAFLCDLLRNLVNLCQIDQNMLIQLHYHLNTKEGNHKEVFCAVIRHEICQKNFTAGFSGLRLYIVNFTEFQQF